MAQKTTPVSAIRKFRHEASILKRKGLVVPNFDGRSVVPTPALRKSISKFREVIDGKATAIKLPPAEIKRLKRAGGYISAHPTGLPERVVVPKVSSEEVITTNRRGQLFRYHPNGIKTLQIPGPVGMSMKDYLESLREKYPTLKNGQYYSFTFFGNRSMMVSDSIDDLVEFLQTGGSSQSLIQAIDSNDIKAQQELISGIAIVKIGSPEKWFEKRRADKAKNTKREWSRVEAKRKKNMNKKGNDLLRIMYRLRKKNTQKDYMERIKKNDPLRYENIVKANRKRAAKSDKKTRAMNKAVKKQLKAAEKAMKKAAKK